MRTDARIRLKAVRRDILRLRREIAQHKCGEALRTLEAVERNYRAYQRFSVNKSGRGSKTSALINLRVRKAHGAYAKACRRK